MVISLTEKQSLYVHFSLSHTCSRKWKGISLAWSQEIRPLRNVCITILKPTLQLFNSKEWSLYFLLVQHPKRFDQNVTSNHQKSYLTIKKTLYRRILTEPTQVACPTYKRRNRKKKRRRRRKRRRGGRGRRGKRIKKIIEEWFCERGSLFFFWAW